MFKLRIETKNDAFVGYKYEEIIRLLKEVIDKLDERVIEGTLHDINGGRVGEYKLTNR